MGAGGRAEEARRLLLREWPWGSKRDQLTERENLVARQLLRSLGFATDCWSVWDELPEPVGLSIGRERAGRVVLDNGQGLRRLLLDELRRERVVCRQVAKADVLAFITQYGESEE